MKLVNSTDFSDSFLRKMVDWICKEIGLAPSWVHQMRFTNCNWGSTRGRAKWHSAIVRIGKPSRFPTVEWRYGGQTCAIEKDGTMGLVSITTHELFHLVQAQDGCRRKIPGKRRRIEGPCVVMANRVAAKFDANREALLNHWIEAIGEPEPELPSAIASMPDPEPCAIAAKTPRSTLPMICERARKTEADLARWMKRFKMAQNKVKKLTKRARYYAKALSDIEIKK